MKIVKVDGPGKKQLEIMIRNLQNKVAKVGWLHRLSYAEKQITVAQVAAIQEFGSPNHNIPARPFFRLTIAAKEKEWKSLVDKGALEIAKGNQSMAEMMEIIGLKAAGDVRKTISTLYTPALAQSTILNRISRNSSLQKIKGRLSARHIGGITKPLIDTGFMLGTLSNSVEDAI